MRRPKLKDVVRLALPAALLIPAACGDDDPPSGPQPVAVAILGRTQSDVAENDEQLAQFERVVVDPSADRGARLIVGVVNDASLTRPQVIADVDLDVSGEAEGNGFVANELKKERVEQLLADVRSALAAETPAPASDPFGAVDWAEQVLRQFPASPKWLVMLTDAVATVEGCNLTARDLSDANLATVIADCTKGHLPDLAGVVVWQGTAGLGLDDPLPAERAHRLEALYRAYWAQTGARLDRYATHLFVAEGE